MRPGSPTPLAGGRAWEGETSDAPSRPHLVSFRSYAVACRRGGVEGLRPSANRLLPARGGRAVGVAPGHLAAAGGDRGMQGGFASPHPSTAYVLLSLT